MVLLNVVDARQERALLWIKDGDIRGHSATAPRTRNFSSRGLSASLPIATLHAGWLVVFAVFLIPASTSALTPGRSSRSTVDAIGSVAAPASVDGVARWAGVFP
jgi:hypothetical protein